MSMYYLPALKETSIHFSLSKWNNYLWGWHPPFWYAVFMGVLGRTHNAKGQYAVRNNSVKSYAALKNSHFLNRFP